MRGASFVQCANASFLRGGRVRLFSSSRTLGSPTSRCVCSIRWFTVLRCSQNEQCAPPPNVKVVTRPRPSSVSIVQSAMAKRQLHQPSASVNPVPASRPASSRPRPISALTLPAAATNPLRSIDTPLGTGKECPGCNNGVAMFEPGVVPGPGTTRWHSRCLICGGPEVRRRSKANIDVDPGCGKRLDRDAKVDEIGGVWCNTCFVSPLYPQICWA